MTVEHSLEFSSRCEHDPHFQGELGVTASPERLWVNIGEKSPNEVCYLALHRRDQVGRKQGQWKRRPRSRSPFCCSDRVEDCTRMDVAVAATRTVSAPLRISGQRPERGIARSEVRIAYLVRKHREKETGCEECSAVVRPGADYRIATADRARLDRHFIRAMIVSRREPGHDARNVVAKQFVVILSECHQGDRVG